MAPYVSENFVKSFILIIHWKEKGKGKNQEKTMFAKDTLPPEMNNQIELLITDFKTIIVLK